MEFGTTPELIEHRRREFLIALYARAGAVFLLPLGLYSLFTGRYLLAAVLLANAPLAFWAMYYSRRTGRVVGASYFFAAQAGGLAAFLALHGGIAGSGIYFTFPLALMMIMVGFRDLASGAYMSLALLGIVGGGLYLGLPGVYDYPDFHQSRLMIGLAAVCLMSVIFEWLRGKSYAAVTDTAERLHADASHDALTGLLNRRGMEDWVASLDKDDFPAVVGIIDIDYFKQINDVHGHDAGDVVLRFLANYLRQSVKGRDQVCRWGGEEFLVIFPHLSAANAAVVLDQIRDEVESRPIRAGNGVLAITFSAGISEMASRTAFRDSLRQADRLLYLAKQGGRNRVVSPPGVENQALGA